MATTSHIRSYDAVSLLGFGARGAESLPEPKPGEIVIRYGGWSLRELRDSPVGKQLIHQHDWYDGQLWSIGLVQSGIYHLRIPVPGCDRKTFAEQQSMLPTRESPAPAVLVATALLVHKLQTGEDPLKSDWTRCNERTTGGSRVALYWFGGRLLVNGSWGGGRHVCVWLASARQTS